MKRILKGIFVFDYYIFNNILTVRVILNNKYKIISEVESNFEGVLVNINIKQRSKKKESISINSRIMKNYLKKLQ